MTRPGNTVDVVIVGGGMAGCALAYSLANTYRVCVLEKRTQGHSQDRVGESLPAAAVRSLRALGLDHAIQPALHGDYHGVVSVWGQAAPVRKDFITSLEGSGLHLDRGILNTRIKLAASCAGVNFIHDAELQTLTLDTHADQWSAVFTAAGQTQQIHARFMVDASGRSGIVARKLGAKRTHLDRTVAIHRQCPRLACAAKQLPSLSSPYQSNTFQDNSVQGNTLIESSEHGWWYRAPLPNGNDIVSFHTDSDLHNTASMRDPKAWLTHLGKTKLISRGLDWGLINHACQAEQNDAAHSLRLTVCAANTSFPSRCAGERWLAIGDAAIAFDPLSSQGMFHALTTALLANSEIHKGLSNNTGDTHYYAKKIAQVQRAYLHNMAEFYQLERRWPNSPFWSRRSAVKQTSDSHYSLS